MKFRNWYQALALILFIVSPSLVFAEKLYLSDTLIVSLRDSASLGGEVVSYLKSGDPLEVIKENEDGFILVQTASGEQGWLQKKYTIDTKPKDLIIADLQGRINSLKVQLESAVASSAAMKASSRDSKAEVRDKEKVVGRLLETIDELKEAVRTAENKYEDLRQKSQNVVDISSERDNLLARLKAVDQEVAQLRVENTELIQTDRILWFLAGFGVFLVGWIMGKFARKSRKRSLSM